MNMLQRSFEPAWDGLDNVQASTMVENINNLELEAVVGAMEHPEAAKIDYMH